MPDTGSICAGCPDLKLLKLDTSSLYNVHLDTDSIQALLEPHYECVAPPGACKLQDAIHELMWEYDELLGFDDYEPC